MVFGAGTTYISGQGVTPANLNGNFDDVENVINGNTVDNVLWSTLNKNRDDLAIISGAGSTSSTSMVSIASGQELTGASSENAVYKIWAIGTRNGAGTGITFPRVVVNDGTNSFSIDGGDIDAASPRGIDAEIFKHPTSGGIVIVKKSTWDSTDTSVPLATSEHTVVSNFMQIQKTFDLQAETADGGTTQVRFKVWRSD